MNTKKWQTVFGAVFLAGNLLVSGSLYAQNLPKNEVFFAQNAKRKGIKTTESGLQYQIKRNGVGKTIQLGDTIKVKYLGKLLNGKVFDKGVLDLVLSEGQVIDGWTEGLQLMKKGGKYRLFVPADLAYGEMSPTPDIPDNAALIFDMEIVSVQKNQSN